MPCLSRLLMSGLMLAGSLLGAAPAWSPIPPSAWAVKPGDPAAPKGAVVVQERIRLNSHDLEWWYRVRIVSEAGKSAAELSGFPERPLELVGRTVYPDGKSVEFNSKKDFKVNTVTRGSFQRKSTVVIPPGVTSDCLVEVYYREAVNWADVSHWERRIMRNHPSQRCSIEFSRGFPMAWSLYGTGFHRPESIENGGERSLVFAQLPAGDDSPYLLESVLEQPTLVVFRIDPALQRAADGGPDKYWQEVAELGYRHWYETSLKKGGRYKAFAKEVLAGLPPERQEAARMITARVFSKIQNLDRLSWEEEQQRKQTKADAPSRIDSEDLGDTVKYGATDDAGMTTLLFQLFRDANLYPKLVMVADRDRRLFRYRTMNRHQFTHVLLGVEDLGKPMLLIDPCLKLLPVGMIHPDYQATYGMQVDSASWSAKPFALPTQSPDLNTQTYEYKLRCEEERIRFDLKAAFTGQPAFTRRVDAYREEPKERNRDLKEDFEKRLNTWTIAEARSENVPDPAKPLTWTLSGQKEWEEGRRTELNPFPGMPNPYYLPDVWPEPRKARIVMPFLKVHKATSTVIVPKGYRVRPANPLNETNLFGQVKWKLNTQPTPEGTQATVELEVVGQTMSAPAEDYKPFKDYMGWIAEAMNRVLIVEKGE